MRPQRGGQQPQGYQGSAPGPADGGILGQVAQFMAQPTAAEQIGAHGQTHSSSAGASVMQANAPHNPATQRMAGQGPAGIASANAASAMPGPAGAVPIGGQGGPMADNLQNGYLHLNLPGSPLGPMGLLSNNYVRRAEVVQDAMLGNEQRMMTGAMPYHGNLPVTQMQQQMMMQQQMAARGGR